MVLCISKNVVIVGVDADRDNLHILIDDSRKNINVRKIQRYSTEIQKMLYRVEIAEKFFLKIVLSRIFLSFQVTKFLN